MTLPKCICGCPTGAHGGIILSKAGEACDDCDCTGYSAADPTSPFYNAARVANGKTKANIRQELREKHQPVFQHQGRKGEVTMCRGCISPSGTLAIPHPCDVVKALEATDN